MNDYMSVREITGAYSALTDRLRSSRGGQDKNDTLDWARPIELNALNAPFAGQVVFAVIPPGRIIYGLPIRKKQRKPYRFSR